MQAVLFDLFGTLVPNITPDAFLRAGERIAQIFGGDPAGVRESLKAQFPMRMTGEIADGPRQFERLANELGLRASDDALAAATRTWRHFLTDAGATFEAVAGLSRCAGARCAVWLIQQLALRVRPRRCFAGIVGRAAAPAVPSVDAAAAIAAASTAAAARRRIEGGAVGAAGPGGRHCA